MEWGSPCDGLFVTPLSSQLSLSLKDHVKVAAFDMDSTLVVPKDPKATFATSRSDWRWWNDAVPRRLRELYRQGYLVIVLSNQSGVSKGTTKISDITGKITDLSKELGFELAAMIACNKDRNRKPCVGMWKHLVGTIGAVNLEESWYAILDCENR
jgi:bifunctional polynucleotide phosphatase/kinase